MNVKKKVVSILAVLAIAVISAYTLPILAAPGNSEQSNETSSGTCDQTCAQDRTRLRDGSCCDELGAGSCDGSQKQHRYGSSTSDVSSPGAALHRYGKGSS